MAPRQREHGEAIRVIGAQRGGHPIIASARRQQGFAISARCEAELGGDGPAPLPAPALQSLGRNRPLPEELAPCRGERTARPACHAASFGSSRCQSAPPRSDGEMLAEKRRSQERAPHLAEVSRALHSPLARAAGVSDGRALLANTRQRSSTRSPKDAAERTPALRVRRACGALGNACRRGLVLPGDACDP